MPLQLSDVTHQPHDKSDHAWVGNAGVAFWVHREAQVSDKSLRMRALSIVANAGGDVDIVHVQLSGTTANVVKTETVTCVAGLNTFEVDSSGVTFGQTTYVGIVPSGGTIAQYKTTTGFDMFSFAADGGTITNNIFEISYWVHYHAIDYLPRVTGKLPLDDFALAEALAWYDDVFVPPGDNTLSASVVVPVQKTIRGIRGKSRLLLAGGITGLDINQADRVTLHDFTIVGNHATVDISSSADISDADDVASLNGIGTEKGIHIRGVNANRCLVSGVEFENIDGSGLLVESSTTSVALNSHGIQASDLSARNCFVAINLADTGEYCTLANLDLANNLIGLWDKGGNNTLVNVNAAYNRVGIAYLGASNDAHGSINGGNSNHCELFGVLMSGITNGQNINGFHNWDSPILVQNSSGVMFNGGTIALSAITNTNSVGTSLVGVVVRNVTYSDGVTPVLKHGVLAMDTGVLDIISASEAASPQAMKTIALERRTNDGNDTISTAIQKINENFQELHRVLTS